MFKKLGQHFLINKSAINKIVSALNLQPNETIIEIGPGKGALTFPLIKECEKIGCKIIAVEKDPTLAERFKVQGSRKNFEVIEGDILKILKTIPSTYNLTPYTYKLIGNIPYYITGKLLRLIGEL
ncbi:MAG: rRNA adenine N-6-methyltransferase family protein, partial [Patescibacteria group bacterium]